MTRSEQDRSRRESIGTEPRSDPHENLVRAAFSSVALLLQPVAAALLAWAILGEALWWWQA
jgi:hypothetical protein